MVYDCRLINGNKYFKFKCQNKKKQKQRRRRQNNNNKSNDAVKDTEQIYTLAKR